MRTTLAEVQPPEEATRRVHLSYRPALDGLRAVAVLAVMVYHAQPSWLPGGFLGVDIFFVISGFLITTLLVREREHLGTIDLPGFWLRRARRLLPAIVLVVAAVGLYALVLADIDELAAIRRDGVATLLYVNNWAQVLQGASYFDAFGVPSPLRHAWSLAIEEQFYFVWPLVVLGALRLTHGRVRVLVPLTLAAACASAALMAALAPSSGDPTRAYYGTDTRAQGLLLGAALAFFVHQRTLPSRVVSVLDGLGAAGLAGLLAMGLLVTDADGWMYDGGFLLAAGLSALVVAAAAEGRLRGNLAGLALALPPLPAIGRISYGLYLWHWPVDVVLSPARTGWGGTSLFLLRTAVTFAVAGLSYVLVERPVRLGDLGARQVLRGMAAAAIATSVLVLAGTVGAVSTDGGGSGEEVGRGDIPVVVVGDSVADGLVRGLPDDVGQVVRVRNGGIQGCGVTPGGALPSRSEEGEALTPSLCERRLEHWADLVAEEPPAELAVVVTGGHEVLAQQVDGRRLEPETPEFAAFYRDALVEDIEVLGASGAQVVLLTAHCMAERTFDGDPSPERNDPARVRWLNEQVQQVAAQHPDVVVADLHGRLCPDGEQVPDEDGEAVYADGVHFTEHGAGLVWHWLAEELDLVRGVG